jgi:DNA polymerase-1
MTSRLLLLDGHAYAYRAFHAIRRLHAPDGSPTNAIFGFVQMLGRLRTALSPSHLGVIWDGGLSAERVSTWPAYKAQRPPMPPDLGPQLDQIITYLEAVGLHSFYADGVEADDYLALAAHRAAAAGLPVVIASSDKDFMQLVAPGIALVNPADKSQTLWTADQVRAKTGVAPEQIVDWLSLIGDAVDNIPGVPGVGPKTATDLLCRFGSVASLYRRLDEVVSERVRANLRAAEADVRRNQHLIRLREDLPHPFQVEDFACRSADPSRLLELSRRWGFRTLAASAAADLPDAETQLPGFV